MATYTVPAGSNLTQAAAALGISLQRLLELNPEYQANPNFVRAGAVIQGEPDPAPATDPAPASNQPAPIGQTPTEPVVLSERPVPLPVVDPEVEAARIKAEADAELFRLEQERRDEEIRNQEEARQRSAFETISSTLSRYGLGSLASWAEGLIRDGASAARVELELYDQPAFQERFPAIFERQERGLAPISAAEYIEYEQVAGQIMRQAGFPEGFYDDPSDFTQLISNDLSIQELQDRVLQSFRDVAEGDDFVRQAYQEFFGINGTAALAAYHLDPDRAAPLLERQAGMARLAGAGRSIEIGISEERAAQLYDRRISEAEAFAGFRQLNELRSLFNETLGETTDLNIEDTGVEATFGLSSNASQILERRRRARVNALRGGGGASVSSQGVIGLGSV